MAQLWRAQVSGGAAIWSASNGDGTPTGPTVTDVNAGETAAIVTYSGSASLYRLDGGSALALDASPATITGLTGNTEYDLEISDDGIAWSAVYLFGTDNVGSGNDDIATDTAITINDGTHAHVAESPSISTDNAVDVDDAVHAHVADSPTATVAGGSDASVVVDDAAHAQAAESITLSLDTWLQIADAAHAHVATAAVVSIPGAFPDALSAFHAYRVPGGAGSFTFTVSGGAGALTYRVE